MDTTVGPKSYGEQMNAPISQDHTNDEVIEVAYFWQFLNDWWRKGQPDLLGCCKQALNVS